MGTMGDQKFPQKDVRNPGVGQGLALAIVKEAKKVLETLEENPDYEPFKYHPLPFSTLAHTALSRELIDRWLKVIKIAVLIADAEKTY